MSASTGWSRHQRLVAHPGAITLHVPKRATGPSPSNDRLFRGRGGATCLMVALLIHVAGCGDASVAAGDAVGSRKEAAAHRPPQEPEGEMPRPLAEKTNAPEKNAVEASATHLGGARPKEIARHFAPDTAALVSDAALFDQVARVPLGESIDVAGADPVIMKNLGLVPDGDVADRYRRLAVVDLSEHNGHDTSQTLVPSYMAELPQIDAIAVSTVDRPHVETPYIYAMLRSLFDMLPVDARVNLLVGGAQWAYLAPEKLAHEIGDERKDRVHLWLPPAETSAFLSEQDACRRGSWNFARGLLSYRGQKALLFLEDDVRWTQNARKSFSHLLAASGLRFVSLYNNLCLGRMPHLMSVAEHGGVQMHVSTLGHGFPYCTQGLVISGEIARQLGRHQMVRINSDCWDRVIEQFLHRHGVEVGFVFPSMLQHEGHQSSGFWKQHYTNCFLERIE